MIIWDTGVYEVLPRRASKREPGTETETDSASDTRSTHQSTPVNPSSPGGSGITGPHKPTESEKLRKAFQNVHVPSLPFPSLPSYCSLLSTPRILFFQN
jgi:hypothetical protein